MGEKTKRERRKTDMGLGLGSIFKGIGNLLDLVSEIAEKGEELKYHVEDEVGHEKGLKAVYGLSIKVGGTGKPIIERFGNLRESTEHGPVVEEVREPLVDVFDEGEQVIVVAELPGVEEADIKYEVKDDILLITTEMGKRKYRKEVVLPLPVEKSSAISSYRNGIFELKLSKSRRNNSS